MIVLTSSASSFMNFGDGNRDWTNMNNMSAPANASTCNTKSSTNTVARTIVAREFGFSQLPKYTEIVGISVSVTRRQSDNNTTRDESVRLVVNNSIVGINKASSVNWGTSFATVTYGGSNDTWGLTTEQLNQIFTNNQVRGDFGMIFRPLTNTSSKAPINRSDLFVSYITITLHIRVRESYVRRNNEWVKVTPELTGNTTEPSVFVRVGNEWQPVSE